MLKALSPLGLSTTEVLLSLSLPASESMVTWSLAGLCCSAVLAGWVIVRDYLLTDRDGDFASFLAASKN